MPGLHEKRKKQRRRRIAFALILTACAVLAFIFVRPLFNGAQGPVPSPSSSPSPTPLSSSALPPVASAPAASAPASSAAPEPSLTGISLYDAVLHVNAAQKALEGKLRLTFVNRTRESLFSAMLNLFPNAVQPNSLTLHSVAAGGQSADYTLSENGVHLLIPLPRELRPGDSVVLYVEYTLLIPETGDRFGMGEGRFMFGNSLPILAVYENGAWREDTFNEQGDSFYSDTADYRVAISAPSGYILSATGEAYEQKSENDFTTTLLIARETRDFAFALHRGAAQYAAYAGDVAVIGVSRSERGAERAATAGAAALSYFAGEICPYPYPKLYVVDFDSAGGMEYPGLVMIDASLLSGSLTGYPELVVAHEVAHQWFYGIVGSDQVNEPWVDESIVEFLGFDCIRHTLGEEAYYAVWNHRFKGYEEYERTAKTGGPLDSFEGQDYFMSVYANGAHMMRALYDEIGRDAFYAALQSYVAEYRYKNATGENLIEAFSSASGKDLSAWFAGWLG